MRWKQELLSWNKEFSADLLILMILRLSTVIQQAIQDHQQIISLYSECLLLERESGYMIKAYKTALLEENTVISHTKKLVPWRTSVTAQWSIIRLTLWLEYDNVRLTIKYFTVFIMCFSNIVLTFIYNVFRLFFFLELPSQWLIIKVQITVQYIASWRDSFFNHWDCWNHWCFFQI